MFRKFACRQSHSRRIAKSVQPLTGIEAIMEEGRKRAIADPCPVPGAFVAPDGRFIYLPVRK